MGAPRRHWIPTPSQRRWLLTGAGLVVVVLAVLSWAALVRADGRRRYDAGAALRTAAGHPATIDALLDRVVVADPRPLTEWRAWQASYLAGPAIPRSSEDRAWRAWVAGGGAPPAAEVAMVTGAAPRFAPALALLRAGPPRIATTRFAALELPPGRRSHADLAHLTMPNLLAIRDLATWSRCRAVLAEDPREPLGDLDRLGEALSEPGCLIDAMILFAVFEERDRAYVETAVRGTLPADLREHWLGEPGRLLTSLADAADDERALFFDPTVVAMQRLPPWAGRDACSALGVPWSPARTIGYWLSSGRDGAIQADYISRQADRLRGSGPLPAWEPATIAVPLIDWVECRATALERDAGWRMARLAVRLQALARTGALPADHTAALTIPGGDALRPPGDHLHLRFERLAADGFGIGIDPSSPAPDFDAPGRMAMRAAAPPADPTPFRWRYNRRIEMPAPTH